MDQRPDIIRDLGNTESYKATSILFYWIGVAFGAPYSMTQINVVNWVYSKWYYKMIRVLIALPISVATIIAFQQIENSEWFI